ncbi:hypothetical protein [Tepidibacillus fermentans]|uniref:Uncharacterized protein n=1 Tax=Tepidibacillus fermentans TaxID=1281767 RepID=A0A4R3KKD1_9BACI|nr:hypothetical protein [Tepidibacillus fermentans]TCS84174.1 hypothetical protein EDD72_102218 [Tepidibacillus fermentans]
MQLKNWHLTVIVFMISLLVLFGGRFIYQNYRIEQPIQVAMSEIKGVKLNQIQYDQQKVELTIVVQDVENFVDTYHQIENKIQPMIGKRELQLHFVNNQDQTLLRAWNQAYFNIAQAMDKNEYSTIPIVLEKLKKQSRLDKVGYGIDEKNVYVDLHVGKKSLYFILPRRVNQGVNNVG